MSRLPLHLIAVAALLGSSASDAHEARHPDGHSINANSYTVWCRIYVTEEGSARTVDVLKVEPHDESEAEIGDAVKRAVLTWTLKPEVKDGKPVSGYVTVPVLVN
jgi:proline racemase